MSGKNSATPQITLRVRPGLLALWKEAATIEGLSLSAWVKELVTSAAVETLRNADEQHGSRPSRKARAPADETGEGDIPDITPLRSRRKSE